MQFASSAKSLIGIHGDVLVVVTSLSISHARNRSQQCFVRNSFTYITLMNARDGLAEWKQAIGALPRVV